MEKPDIALATSMEPPTEDTKKEFARVRVMLLCWNITSDIISPIHLIVYFTVFYMFRFIRL